MHPPTSETDLAADASPVHSEVVVGEHSKGSAHTWAVMTGSSGSTFVQYTLGHTRHTEDVCMRAHMCDLAYSITH